MLKQCKYARATGTQCLMVLSQWLCSTHVVQSATASVHAAALQSDCLWFTGGGCTPTGWPHTTQPSTIRLLQPDWRKHTTQQHIRTRCRPLLWFEVAPTWTEPPAAMEPPSHSRLARRGSAGLEMSYMHTSPVQGGGKVGGGGGRGSSMSPQVLVTAHVHTRTTHH
mgnify:CR=1 FL=1